MKLILHDPTAELAPVQRPRRQPPLSLDGKQVALFDIGKPRSDEFLDAVDSLLTMRGISTVRFSKPTNTRTAPVATLQAIATSADVVVVALSDWGSCTSCGLHDVKDLDDRGIPGCFVVTTEFEQAAELQSRALGFKPGIVWAPHPVQNRTSEELARIAEDLIADILSMLVSSSDLDDQVR